MGPLFAAVGDSVDRIAAWLLAATVFLAPWGSVGVLQSVAGRSIGFGMQPAMLGLLALIVVALVEWRRDSRLRESELFVVVALMWTVVASTST